jgi:hypothetical protein
MRTHAHTHIYIHFQTQFHSVTPCYLLNSDFIWKSQKVCKLFNCSDLGKSEQFINHVISYISNTDTNYKLQQSEDKQITT